MLQIGWKKGAKGGELCFAGDLAKEFNHCIPTGNELEKRSFYLGQVKQRTLASNGTIYLDAGRTVGVPQCGALI